MQQMIYLLRHGETEFNTQGRYQGQLDSPLTELGREQVQQN
ncbi:MAG TPA: histidine phosphatase family protein, partial [Lysinibacillus sp.]|nr:histidine phosphatase family protein [Lysinibacillus sp.]